MSVAGTRSTVARSGHSARAQNATRCPFFPRTSVRRGSRRRRHVARAPPTQPPRFPLARVGHHAHRHVGVGYIARRSKAGVRPDGAATAGKNRQHKITAILASSLELHDVEPNCGRPTTCSEMTLEDRAKRRRARLRRSGCGDGVPPARARRWGGRRRGRAEGLFLRRATPRLAHRVAPFLPQREEYACEGS